MGRLREGDSAISGGQYCQRVVQITDRPKTQSLKSLQMLSLIASKFNHSCFVKSLLLSCADKHCPHIASVFVHNYSSLAFERWSLSSSSSGSDEAGEYKHCKCKPDQRPLGPDVSDEWETINIHIKHSRINKHDGTQNNFITRCEKLKNDQSKQGEKCVWCAAGRWFVFHFYIQ